MALTDAGARARIGVVPPLWLLLLLVAAGALIVALSRQSLARAWPLALASFLWLPWLPVRVPAAFMIWDGPLEALLWTAIALGLVLPYVARRVRDVLESVGHPRAAPWLAAALAVAASLAGAAAVSERVPAGDEPHYLIVTQSLLLDGDLRIENNHRRDDYLPYYPYDLRRPDFMRRGVDGQIYSVHPPGVSVLVLPAFALAGYAGALVWLTVVSALGGALAWLGAWLLTRDASASWIAWAGVTFSVPVFFHSFTIYPDTAGATCVMFVVWLLVRMETGAGAVARRSLGAAGAALAALPWLHTRFAIVAAGLGVVVIVRLLRRPDPWRAASVFLAAPVVGATLWFGYFWVIYGAPDPSLPYNGLGQNQLSNLAAGLAGLLIDQQFGLFPSAPFFAAALAGTVALARRTPRLALELGLVTLVYLATVGTYTMWWAGQSPPARFLVVLLWPAVLPVACLWHGARSSATRAIVVAALVLGSAGVLARVMVDAGAMIYNARDGYDLLLGWASPTASLPLAFPSLHRDDVMAAINDAAAWTAVIGIAIVALRWCARYARPGAGALWTLSMTAAALTLMVGSSLVWALHGQTPLTPAASQLAFLRAWNPAWRQTALALRPVRWLSIDDVVRRFELSSDVRLSARGEPAAEPPLLQIGLIAAGDYALVIRGSSRLQGTLRVTVGRTEQVLERWPLDGRSPGAAELVLRLPVDAQSVTIEGDAEAHARIDRLTLNPRHVVPARDRLSGAFARRASRYGSARAFFMDDDSFMEPAGFWTRGESPTAVVIDAPDRNELGLRVRNGAVANRVELSAAEWHSSLSLAPGEVRDVDLPAAAARLLRIQTAAGFRPADVDPASGDRRTLGVWVEFREP